MNQSQSDGLVSLTDAIKCKYLDSDTLDEVPGISFSTYGGGYRSLVYERSDKLNSELRALEKRTEIDLQSASIGSVDSDTQLFSKLRNVRVLDISFNHLSSWKQIAAIIDNFHSLRHIIVTGNPLKSLNDIHAELINSFQKVKVITMGKLNYDWDELVKCSDHWPEIEGIDAFSNSITEIVSPPKTLFENLTSLTLDHNKIVHWKYVNNLGHLKRLKILKLVDCGLESVEIDQNEKLFLNLIHLDLKTNHLQSWKDIANLKKLPALEELIIRDNPLFDDINFDYAFNFVLSTIGHLKMLNRQQITLNARKDGEIHYLRFYYLKYLRSIDAGDDTFMEENPRYIEILKKYGAPLDLVPKNKQKSQSKLIEITISSADKRIKKKIPRTTTITALKTLIKKLFTIDDSNEICLWVESRNDTNQVIDYPLDKEEYNLDFYSVKENDCIVVKYD